jgi:hypothetical protein
MKRPPSLIVPKLGLILMKPSWKLGFEYYYHIGPSARIDHAVNDYVQEEGRIQPIRNNPQLQLPIAIRVRRHSRCSALAQDYKVPLLTGLGN